MVLLISVGKRGAVPGASWPLQFDLFVLLNILPGTVLACEALRFNLRVVELEKSWKLCSSTGVVMSAPYVHLKPALGKGAMWQFL